MHFTARQLEIFVAAANEGSFARAADTFGISQAAVSNHIRLLEKEFGQPLFERRIGTTPLLTPCGSKLLAETKRFLTVSRQLATATPETARPIRIYAGSHLLDHYIRPALPAFLGRFPDFRIQFLPEGSREKVAQWLERGAVDIAIVVSPKPDVFPNSTVLTRIRSGLYASENYAGGTSPDELSQQRMILPEDSPDGTIVRQHLLERGIRPSGKVVVTQYPAVMVQLVTEGVGVAPLLASMASGEAARGKIRRVLDLPDWFVCVSRSTASERPQSIELSTFFQEMAADIDSAASER